MQLEVSQQAADRRLMASALTARTTKIKELVEAVVAKLASPEPGSDFVRSVAEALDAGEMQITELKAEQRQNYGDLARQARQAFLRLECNLGMLACIPEVVCSLAHSLSIDVISCMSCQVVCMISGMTGTSMHVHQRHLQHLFVSTTQPCSRHRHDGTFEHACICKRAL